MTFANAALANAGPCPFCKCAQLWLWDKGVPGRFAVACSNPECAATGPIAETESQAVERWNAALRRVEARPNAALGRVLDEAHDGAPHSSQR